MMVADPATLAPVPRDAATMGEIMMRGNITMKGYLKNPAATEEAFAGGWFHTGDLAVWHPDGYVEIRDRSKDIIISGGENISTIEVEDVLYRHPAVLEAAVVARPDAKWGETPCAFVTLRPGATATAGRDHRLLPRADGALQGAAHRGVRPAAEDQHRQDAEIRAARTGAATGELSHAAARPRHRPGRRRREHAAGGPACPISRNAATSWASCRTCCAPGWCARRSCAISSACMTS